MRQLNGPEDGLEVTYVAQGSPAEEVGLRPGDVIIRVGEWDVEKIGSAQRVLLSLEPGSLLEVTWVPPQLRAPEIV